MDSEKKILVVDDSKPVLGLIDTVLSSNNYQVTTASNGAEAIDSVQEEEFSAVLMDLKMPDMEGLDLLENIREISPGVVVIILTAHGSAEMAVRAMKAGAYDYITKPFNPDELILIVNNAVERNDLLNENRQLREELEVKYQFSNIIGRSSAMQKVYDIVSKVLDSKATVLVQGESGTGKELIARAIHYNGIRREEPFVKVDCTTIPEGLMESELFGHEKGAFTGAIKMRNGKFEMADMGSVFLDEISEIKPDLQAKLLRVLQEREFERVGGTKTIKVDIRLIAATNRDLKKEVEEGRFREDLYYRLNVIPILVPPLRDRTEDIPLLVEHFIQKYNLENNRDVEGIERGAMDLLMEYKWPGNVRELENVVERAVVIGSGKRIRIDNLPLNIQLIDERATSQSADEWPSLEVVEKKHITNTLRKVGWNRAEAARLLRIHRNTLRRKITTYDIAKEESG